MEGLEKFRKAFAEFTNQYVIIGGTACDIAMTGTVVRPRVTHDIDMIVIVENMTEAFGERFWQSCVKPVIGRRNENRQIMNLQVMNCIAFLMARMDIRK